MELTDLLTSTAYRIDAEGTRTQSRILGILAAAVRRIAPGAAAALVDWEGSEIARQRAFGIVHGIVLHELDERDRDMVLFRLDSLAASRALARVA